MLTAIGTAIGAVVGTLLLTAVFAGFAYLCFQVGMGAVRGFFQHVGEQAGVGKLTDALLFGPLAAGMAFVGFGLAALSALPLPALLLNWLAPQALTQVESWLDGPAASMVMTRLAMIAFDLLFACFALGVSLTMLRGVWQLARTLHTFAEVLALLLGLGLGIVFLYISLDLFAVMLTGKMLPM
jgi:hypothetical protein